MSKNAKLNRETAIAEILESITRGKSLRSILPDDGRPEHLPARNTFLTWIDEDKELSYQYARARELGADALVEEMEDKISNVKDMVDAARVRLLVDVRKWALSKQFPKKYGDRTQVAQTDTDGNDKEVHTIIIKKK